MITFANLLNLAKDSPAVGSWYRLARELGISDNSVTKWRHGDTLPTDEMTLRLADLAGVPAGLALAIAHAAKQPPGSRLRAAWVGVVAVAAVGVPAATAVAVMNGHAAAAADDEDPRQQRARRREAQQV